MSLDVAVPVVLFFATCLTLLALYLFLVVIGAYRFRKKVNYAGAPLRLTVVIPAHNEEGQIRATVEAVRASDYPSDSVRTYVIADNCTDLTEREAARAGARVVTRDDPGHRGKGQALDWFLKKHARAYRHGEAVVMLDADTIPDRGFLREIAASLRHPGVYAVQGFYGVANPEEHWRSRLMAAAFAVFNHLRPAGHNALGGTAGLRGNGMGFSTDLLLRYGWPAYSVIEDYEFCLELLSHGIVVHYNPDAVVMSAMPTERRSAETQRIRWESGFFSMKRKFLPGLVKQVVKRPSLACLDAVASFFLPPLSLLILTQAIVTMGLLLAAPAWLPLAALWLFVDLAYVFSGLFLRRCPRAVWLGIAAAPLFVLWKIPLYFKTFLRRDRTWERTRRHSELSQGAAHR